ncbi:hypothetical protein [Streptomyces sp. NPDC004629]|uniref:hypothetical protein n=1 Tax=Streptomyces sp. NPDC004629 TaxID=3364705 RepID=UPI00369FA993
MHPDGNLVRHVRLRRGDAQHGPLPPADVVVCGEYEVGMQDHAFRSALALP